MMALSDPLPVEQATDLGNFTSPDQMTRFARRDSFPLIDFSRVSCQSRMYLEKR